MKVGMPAGIASLVFAITGVVYLLFAAVLLREHWLHISHLPWVFLHSVLVLLATQQGQSGMTLAGFLLTILCRRLLGLGNIIIAISHVRHHLTY